MSDLISSLLRFYEKIDTSNRWGIDPDEAVEITLANSSEYLCLETVDNFVNSVLEVLGGIGYERLGDKVKYVLDRNQEDELSFILRDSDYCKKERNFIDLSNATEIVVNDGLKIPINKKHS